MKKDHNLREILKGMGIEQEFTHIASPQENGFIEFVHSQIQREVIDRYIFDSIHEADWTIARSIIFTTPSDSTGKSATKPRIKSGPKKIYPLL